MTDENSFHAEVIRATDEMTEELKAEFERFWAVVDPNAQLSPGVKEIARWMFLLGAKANRRSQESAQHWRVNEY